MLSLTFHGAAGMVTGSCTEVDTVGARVLVDCGLFQGPKALRQRNWKRPDIEPRSVDAVVLTHAHLDHTGWLPRLVRNGYDGPVFATRASIELTELILRDSAKIQEEDADYANRKGFSKHHPALPLYTREDAELAIKRLVNVEYDEWFELHDGLRVRLHQAGHILGSGHLELEATLADEQRRVFFSGDVGRYDAPLVPDPESLRACDALVVESTYGDREHSHSPEEVVFEHILRRAVTEGGVVLFPAFAVGRSQQLLYLLNRTMLEHRDLEMPIHLDSPMAVEATRIYERHPEESGLEELALRRGTGPVYGDNVYLHRTSDESKALNSLEGPRVIVASSGMLTGGRILHHLKQRLGDSRTTLVLGGFQAEETRGRRLEEGAKFLRIHGQDIPVKAHIERLTGLSAHADRTELLRWIGDVVPTRRTFVNHGEPEPARAFAQELGTRGHTAVVPELGRRYEL
ncbi:MAG: MBL fold metallo-hydrolase [Planctomycetota bacterium]